MAGARREVAQGVFIGERDLSLTLRPARSLLAAGALAEVDRVLREVLPRWSRKLRVGVELGVRSATDASKPGSLARAVRKHIRPGRHYAALVKRYGPGDYKRTTGFVMLGGAYSGVSVFLNLDEWLFGPDPDGQHWGNSVSIDINRDAVEETPSSVWMSNACATLCEAMEFAHGFARCDLEYYAKNMETKGSSSGFTHRAIGLDPSRYLPGLYWLNVFGKPYVKLIGKDRLLTTPGATTSKIGPHVAVQLGGDPYAWDTRTYKAAVNRALGHIGRQYFFDRRARKRKTVAPPFHFESDDRDAGRL